jgi:glycosyltransferase involved in cell wall biosynthesis
LAIRRQVLTLHDTSFIDTPEYFGKKFVAWYRWLIPRLVRRVAAILTVSEFSKRQIVRYFDVAPRRITVVPNGVEGFAPASPELIAAARGWFRLENDYLLYVGSLKPSKNLAGLLAAWERSRLAADGVQLAIAGGLGPVFGKCDLERLPPGVKLLGYVEDEWLPALYSGALAFVFPTLYEGFGMPAVEAMACRTAVVTSDCTSMPEIVGDAALLVDPRSVESISAGMRRIVEDETLRTGLQLRGSTMSRQYSWERAADLTWAAIERVRQAS